MCIWVKTRRRAFPVFFFTVGQLIIKCFQFNRVHGHFEIFNFFLKKIVFETKRTTKVKLFYVNVICDWPTKTCCAAVVGINVYNILGNSVAHFRLGLPL